MHNTTIDPAAEPYKSDKNGPRRQYYGLTNHADFAYTLCSLSHLRVLTHTHSLPVQTPIKREKVCICRLTSAVRRVNI